MSTALFESLGVHGELVPGPPWIFGLRGVPRETPEHTLIGFERALQLGLDGIAYDVRACASGELLLATDATLERTTDGHGAFRDASPSELHALDAGGWFAREFVGQHIPWLEQVLALRGNAAGTFPQHLIDLREPPALPELVRTLEEHARGLSVRVVTARRSTALELRDLGFSPLVVLARPNMNDLRWVRDERITAVGARSSAWRLAPDTEWPCERFCFDVDEPDELLVACRRPFNGLTTTEPRRALAIRALAHLTRGDDGAYPLRASELAIQSDTRLSSRGEWCGAWQVDASLRNPFAFAVEVEFELAVRRGAFDASDLGTKFRLEPGQEHALRFELIGGSWSPGGDPLLYAHLFEVHPAARSASETQTELDTTPLAPNGSMRRPFLSLDAPLCRRRSARLADFALRLPLLRESPRDPPASVTIRRHRHDLLAAIEDAGDLVDARILVHLDGELHSGSQGVRVSLPPDFTSRPGGVPFSIGLRGTRATPRGPRIIIRRWSGGLPDTVASGTPGRLFAKP